MALSLDTMALSLDALTEVAAQTTELISTLRRSVVLVRGRDGHGAGVAWGAPNGAEIVVTNDHVVRGDRGVVETADGRMPEASRRRMPDGTSSRRVNKFTRYASDLSRGQKKGSSRQGRHPPVRLSLGQILPERVNLFTRPNCALAPARARAHSGPRPLRPAPTQARAHSGPRPYSGLPSTVALNEDACSRVKNHTPPRLTQASW